MDTFADPNLVPSLLREPDQVSFSVVTVNSGWPDDLLRLATSLSTHCATISYEIVAIANDSEPVELALETLEESGKVRGVSFGQRIGFGAAVATGIRRTLGATVVLADTSVEASGDALTPLQSELANAKVGLVGKWGLTTPDLLEFKEKVGGEVDALQGYFMAFRRADAERVGLPNHKFKFYRHADIDYSLTFRAAGFKVLSVELPLRRHIHREWDEMPADQRDKRSKDNHARLLRSWRARTDLLLNPTPHEH